MLYSLGSYRFQVRRKLLRMKLFCPIKKARQAKEPKVADLVS